MTGAGANEDHVEVTAADATALRLGGQRLWCRGPEGRRRPRRGRRGLGRAIGTLLAVVGAQLVVQTPWSVAASPLSIDVVYDPGLPGAVDPCSDQVYVNDQGQLRQGPLRACQGGVDRTGDLQLIMEAVADWYADAFRDDHEVTIRWAWLGPFDTLPDAKILAREPGTERPTEARIRIPADTTYFYDPTPQADEEFTMRPRLYRTVHPVEQQAAFDGSPPEVLDVAYVGRSALQPDLVTHVSHEMGHTLGLGGGPVVGPGPACHGEDDPYFRPDPALLGGASMGIKALPNDTPAQQCVHLDLGGIQECKTDPAHKVGNQPDVDSTLPGLTLWECASHQSLFWSSELPLARVRPGVADLLAIAGAGGWQELHLPRKYTAGTGDWNAPSTWIGNRVPDADDDVYLVNQVAGTKVWDTPAAGAGTGSVYVSEQNTLRVVGMPLQVADRIHVAGPASEAGPLQLAGASGAEGGDEVAGSALTRVEVGSASAAGTLHAARGVVEDGAALDLRHPASTARIGRLDSDGVVLGRGTVRTSTLSSSGRIRAVGGTLVFATPESDPGGDLAVEPAVLDLDGPGPFESPGEILAVDGDLVFDGIVADPVEAAMTVGSGRSMTFTSGWHQEWAGVLLLDGTPSPASVVGHSMLDGTVVVHGLGRFEDDLALSSLARVRLSLAGTEVATEHDALAVDGLAELGGVLMLELAPGYQPAPMDAFTVATYGSRVGEFTSIVGTELDGGLILVPDYQDQQLVLMAGFAGASPDEADCTGDAVAQQVGLHGSLKKAADFHGMTVKELQDAVAAYCGV